MSDSHYKESPREVIFEMGDLVRVTDNTHQDGMPPSRVGVITGIGQGESGSHSGVYKILFASSEGQVEMIFWHKFLEKISP